MSVEATNGEVVSLVSRLRDALIAKGKLTQEGAVRIEEAMRARSLGYGDAAIQLGLITPADLEEAAEVARQLSPKTADGIVEGAMNKMAFNRGLPVKYVGVVRAGPSLILVNDPDNSYCEQIRALRKIGKHTSELQSP